MIRTFDPGSGVPPAGGLGAWAGRRPGPSPRYMHGEGWGRAHNYGSAPDGGLAISAGHSLECSSARAHTSPLSAICAVLGSSPFAEVRSVRWKRGTVEVGRQPPRGIQHLDVRYTARRDRHADHLPRALLGGPTLCALRAVCIGPAAENPRSQRALSSGGERFPDTEEVRGSNPLAPTRKAQVRGGKSAPSVTAGQTPPPRKGRKWAAGSRVSKASPRSPGGSVVTRIRVRGVPVVRDDGWMRMNQRRAAPPRPASWLAPLRGRPHRTSRRSPRSSVAWQVAILEIGRAYQ